MLWNQPEHLELYFALPSMGAVIHTLNPRLHRDELSFIVNDAEDRAIVVDESLLEVFETFQRRPRVRARDRRLALGLACPTATSTTRRCSPAPSRWSGPRRDERRAAAMCYTSGTTGRPKGVVYSHRSLVLHSLVAALPDVKRISSRDTLLPVVPMFHANAWGLPYTAALVGAGLVLPGPKLDAVSVLDLLADEKVTITAGVPTVWMAVLAGDRRRARPLGPERAAPAARRRLGGAPEHARGLRSPRADDHPRLGHDRDLAAGQRLPAAASSSTTPPTRSSYDYRGRQGDCRRRSWRSAPAARTAS